MGRFKEIERNQVITATRDFCKFISLLVIKYLVYFMHCLVIFANLFVSRWALRCLRPRLRRCIATMNSTSHAASFQFQKERRSP
jgi:hypothetical protein